MADYRPVTVAENKIKKSPGDMSIALERTTDILSTAQVSTEEKDRCSAGFRDGNGAYGGACEGKAHREAC